MSGPFAKPQHIFGQCSDCGAIAWELLSGVSPYCMGCDSASYRQDSDEDYEEDWQHPDDPWDPPSVLPSAAVPESSEQ